MTNESDPLFRDIERFLNDHTGLISPPSVSATHIEIFNQENEKPSGHVVMQVYADVTACDQLEEEFAGIQDCIVSAFGGTITEDDARDHARGDLVMIGKTEDGRVACFGSAEFCNPRKYFDRPDLPDEEGLYIAAVAVRRDEQGKGLYKKMLQAMIDFGLYKGMNLFFTRTQNPRIKEGILHDLDARMSQGQIASYSVDETLIKGCYERMLTVDKPISRGVVFDTLTYEKGDAYIFIFETQKPSIS